MKINFIDINNLYIHVKKIQTKFFAIVLLFLIITNIAFVNTKTYSFLNDKNVITTVLTQDQYDASIYASDMNNLIKLVKMPVKINYLYVFPEESILFFYFGYFITISGIILNFKILKDD